MQPIVHFILSIVAGLGVGLHMEDKRKKYSVLIILALAATAMDLDHLLPIYHETRLKAFHNIFVFVFIPVILLLFFFFYEHGKNTSIRQRACTVLCVMFFGHMITDAITETGIPIFYPLSTDRFMVGDIGIAIHPDIFTLSSAQVLMIVWGVVIGIANLYETLTYNDVEKRKYVEDVKSYRTCTDNTRTWPIPLINGISFQKNNASNNYLTCERISSNTYMTMGDDDTRYLIDFANGLIDRKWP